LYLHLGNDVIIKKINIIAIINSVNDKSVLNKDFLKIAEIEGKSTKVSDLERTKSMVITDQKIYLSNISSTTLYKRSNYNQFELTGSS
jgi:hypothetical protein